MEEKNNYNNEVSTSACTAMPSRKQKLAKELTPWITVLNFKISIFAANCLNQMKIYTLAKVIRQTAVIGKKYKRHWLR